MRARLEQMLQAWRLTRQADPQAVWWVAGAGALGFLLFFLVGWLLLGSLVIGIGAGVLFGILGAMIAFGRRAQQAQIAQIEGVPGAAAAVLQSMRGQWFVTPVVAVTRSQDLVHRVVGRPGVILVGEGSPARVKQLLAQERKKMNRVTGDDVPVHTVIVAEQGKNTVPLGKLQMHVGKLPRELGKREVPKLERKLKPLDKGNIPMPKGYIPNPGKKMR